MPPTRPPFVDPPALPPPGFDPVGNSADAARLADDLLPPRPDRSSQAELHAQRLWCQWWRRDSADEDALPWTIEGVPIAAGDRVYCSLTVVDQNQVLIHVANRTKQTFATIIGSGPVPVMGSTAQWIV